MSAHVLLNLLNESGKSDKMQGNEFNKFNNTGAQMLDSVYHMRLKLLLNHIFLRKRQGFYHICVTLLQLSIHNVTRIFIPLVVYRF